MRPEGEEESGLRWGGQHFLLWFSTEPQPQTEPTSANISGFKKKGWGLALGFVISQLKHTRPLPQVNSAPVVAQRRLNFSTSAALGQL